MNSLSAAMVADLVIMWVALTFGVATIGSKKINRFFWSLWGGSLGAWVVLMIAILCMGK